MIFILGGNGFMGSAITRYCYKSGIEYAVIDRNNYQNFMGQYCDILINANGNSKMYLANKNPMEDFEKSVTSVQKSLIHFSTGLYIYLSSCDVYPDFSLPHLTTEETILDITKQRTYGFHKFVAEQCVKHVAKKWLILRLSGLIGPNLSKNPIFDILNDKPLWINPNSEMQLIHTDLVAKIIFELIAKNISQEIFNVCCEGSIELNEVISFLNKSIPVQKGSPTVKYNVSINKLNAIMPLPTTRELVLDFVKNFI